MVLFNKNRLINAYNFGHPAEIYNKIIHRFLSKKYYKNLLREFSSTIFEKKDYGEQKKGNYVFTLWLQGADKAPSIVRICKQRA